MLIKLPTTSAHTDLAEMSYKTFQFANASIKCIICLGPMIYYQTHYNFVT